ATEPVPTGGEETTVVRAAGGPAAAPVGVPHSEQNLAPATSVAPQLEHVGLRVVPHAEQNFADAAFALPQFVQTMDSVTPPRRDHSQPSRVVSRRLAAGHPEWWRVVDSAPQGAQAWFASVSRSRTSRWRGPACTR